MRKIKFYNAWFLYCLTVKNALVAPFDSEFYEDWRLNLDITLREIPGTIILCVVFIIMWPTAPLWALFVVLYHWRYIRTDKMADAEKGAKP